MAATGVGLLTGLGCAALEHLAVTVIPGKKSHLLPLVATQTWITERALRSQA